MNSMEFLVTPVQELGLSVRALGFLRLNGVKDFGEFLRLDLDEEKSASRLHIGARTWREIEDMQRTVRFKNFDLALQEPPVDQGSPEKTKRVRILVAIDSDGSWSSHGYSGHEGTQVPDDQIKDSVYIDDLGTCLAYRWIEADVPVPTETVIAGKVVEDN